MNRSSESAAQAQTSGSVVRNGRARSTRIVGTTNDYFAAQGRAIADGRPFTQAEEAAGKAVCVIGETVAKDLFEGMDAVGHSFRVRGISCEVVGILRARGQSSFGDDQDDLVVMPISAVQRRLTGTRDIGSITISTDPAYDAESVKASLTSLLRERRGSGGASGDDFTVLDTRQISEAVSGTTRTLTALLGSIAAISLVVGGIGIMNIMLVSVTERTREIGIRLAIGALRREVLLQFLVEAVVLACLGGLIGILLAFGATLGLAKALGIPFLFNPQINVLSFLICAIIGIVFGYFPARRAAALNPIEALRHE